MSLHPDIKLSLRTHPCVGYRYTQEDAEAIASALEDRRDAKSSTKTQREETDQEATR